VKPFVLKAAGLMALVALAMGAAAPAYASHMHVTVVEPTPAMVGQASELDATLTSADTGQPVAGVSVTFLAHGSFERVDGYMEIGRAVTNSQGVAAISYVPRESGTHDIRVDYASPADATAEQTTASVAVQGSPDQFYVQKAGIQVPGLNSWLIIALLSTVWGILFFVATTVIRIAHAGGGSSLVVGRQSLAAASSGSLRSGVAAPRK
jgi:hypothetical protein